MGKVFPNMASFIHPSFSRNKKNTFTIIIVIARLTVSRKTFLYSWNKNTKNSKIAHWDLLPKKIDKGNQPREDT